MRIKLFLGNIARMVLAIGFLSMAAVAGAVEINEAPTCGWGYNQPGYLTCGVNDEDSSFLDTLRYRVDFLWWRASEDGLTLGLELDNITPQRKNPDFKFDAGFRIGLSSIYNNCCDIGFNWTYFRTRALARGTSDFMNPNNLILFDNFWEGVAGVTPDTARARWSFDMDLLDLELGRKCTVYHDFVLRLYTGLRGARLDQSFRVSSRANRLTGPGSPAQFESHMHARNDFWGLGPRVGLDLEFKFPLGISLFGQVATSLLYGRFKNKSRERFNDFLSMTCIDLHFNSSSQRVLRTIIDLALGLQWDHYFEWCCRLHPVSLVLTWEHHGFLKFNNFQFNPASVEESSTTSVFVPTGSCGTKFGDLFTHGLTVSAEVGF